MLPEIRVPPEACFQTKPPDCPDAVGSGACLGLLHHCLMAEADYGDNPDFLAGWRSGTSAAWWECKRIFLWCAHDEPGALCGE
jgi:hypothetical protein